MAKAEMFPGSSDYSITALSRRSRICGKSGILFDGRLFACNLAGAVGLFGDPRRISGVTLLVCRRGWLNGSVNLVPVRIEEGTLSIFHPEHLLQLWSQSDDFEASVLVLSPQFAQELHIDREGAIQIFVCRECNFAIRMSEEEYADLNIFYEIIHRMLESSNDLHREAIVQRLLEAMVYKIQAILQNRMPEITFHRGRREEFFERFMQLLAQYYWQTRNIGFYAERLHVTPKYLSSVVKEVSGKSAAQWIGQRVIQEAKTLLRHTNFSIQEIAYQLNFASQSFFGKYFKRHTGVSPSEYKLGESRPYRG